MTEIRGSVASGFEAVREAFEANFDQHGEVGAAFSVYVDGATMLGYDIAGCSVPAELVGGDYFDYIELDDGRLGVCLGDVSGKGVPASLLMRRVRAYSSDG